MAVGGESAERALEAEEALYMSVAREVGDVVTLHCWCGNESMKVLATRRSKRFSVVTCEACDTCYNFPRPVPDKEAASRCYCESKSFPERYSPQAEVWAHEYVEHMSRLLSRRGLRLTAYRKVLDVGCGGGQLVAILCNMGMAAEGIDLDSKCIAYAKRLHPQGTFHIGRIEDLDRGPYDLITGMNLLEHVPDPKPFTETVSKMLVPGGIFIGVVPNISSVSFAVLGAHWGLLSPSEHVTLFAPPTLSVCLRAAGFTAVDWFCARNPLILPLQAVRQFLDLTRSTGWVSAGRYVVWCALENAARTLTALSRRTDAGEKLFFLARKGETI